MDIVLSSSPVWYQTRSCDTSCEGFFAFSSRNHIYLLNIQHETPQHFGVLSGHEERVATCSFGHKKSSDGLLYLVSGGDDSFVKIWNVYTKSVKDQHKAHGNSKVVAVHWSPLSEHLIASADDKGCLILWNLERNLQTRYHPDSGHMQMCALCFSPHYQNLIAVAYKTGAVSVIDINNKGVVYRKFRGHGNEIHSIVWSFLPQENIFTQSKCDPNEQGYDNTSSPINQNDHGQDNKTEGILVTGSKDRTIRLWSLSKGKCLKVLKLPVKPTKGRKVNEDTTRLYVALHWPQNSVSQFVSSSYNGDILLWDLSKNEKEQYQVLSSQSSSLGHQRVVFSINSGLDPCSNIITTSMDRYIKMWSLATPQSPPTCSLPTLGGYVYAIAISPIDPSVVALGIGDGNIRIWKTKNPRNPFDITVLWQGVKDKVMSLAWHPTKEGALAFGTEDGKVGLYDVLSPRPPVISESYHLKAVYAMSWGPKCYLDESEASITNKLYLFTTGGEGTIRMHHPTLRKDGVDINTIITVTNQHTRHQPGRRSEVKWRKDGEFVAIGNDNGTCDIYRSPYLQHVVTVKVHCKIINSLSWCPVSSDQDTHCWLASGSNDSNVCIVDLKRSVCPATASDDVTATSGQSTAVITEPYRMLSDHSGRITGLSWNPNQPTQLASASYDGTVQVWDVCSGSGVSNYRGHDGRVLCVDWSPVVDENRESGQIFSGADDYSVHIWKYEKQDNKLPPRDAPHVGYTQKNTSMWKRKNKKKKPSGASSSSKGTEPSSSMNTEEVKEVNGHLNLEELLERKKQELLADMDLGSEGSTRPKRSFNEDQGAEPGEGHSGLNPNALPWKSSDSDNQTRELLTELSDNRKIAMEAEESQRIHRRRNTNLLPLSCSLDNQKKKVLQRACIDVVKYKTGHVSSDSSEQSNLGLFGDKISTYRMLRHEDERLLETKNHDGSYTLKIMQGNIVGAVESAIELNDLTDQLVALAILAGYDVWQKACTSFAEQLIKDGRFIHAAHYLIATNKIREAIILLRENKLYREAIALARARLHDDDELVIETVKTWAVRLQNGGALDMAAKCFAWIGHYSQAASCLCGRATSKTSAFNRDDLSSLFAASTVTRLGGLLESPDYAKRALDDVMKRSGRWNEAQQAADEHDLKACRLILSTHELLVRLLALKLPVAVFPLHELYSDLSWSDWNKDLNLTCSSFGRKVLEVWIDHVILSGETTSSLFEEIEKFLSKSSESDLTLKQALCQISIHLTCCLFSIHLNLNGTLHHLGYEAHMTSCMEMSKTNEIGSLLDDVYTSLCEMKGNQAESDSSVINVPDLHACNEDNEYAVALQNGDASNCEVDAKCPSDGVINNSVDVAKRVSMLSNDVTS